MRSGPCSRQIAITFIQERSKTELSACILVLEMTSVPFAMNELLWEGPLFLERATFYATIFFVPCTHAQLAF